MTAFEEILDQYREDFFGKIPEVMFEKFQTWLTLRLDCFEISKKEQSLCIFDGGDADLLRRFFLAKAVRGLSQRSLKLYNNNLERFQKGIRKHLADVTSDDVRLYLAQKKVQGASDSYLANIQRTLSSFYTWLYENELIKGNPLLKVEKVKIHKRLEKPLTDEQMEAVRMNCRTLLESALVEFLFCTGCRISEALSINRAEVDFESMEVKVIGKGNKERTVYLSPRAKFALIKYLSIREDINPALFVSGYELRPAMQRLVESNNGGVLPHNRLDKNVAGAKIRAIGKRVGVRLHPHLLRKTVATSALRKGMPIDQVSKMLGHASLDITSTYAQTAEEDLKISHSKFI